MTIVLQMGKSDTGLMSLPLSIECKGRLSSLIVQISSNLILLKTQLLDHASLLYEIQHVNLEFALVLHTLRQFYLTSLPKHGVPIESLILIRTGLPASTDSEVPIRHSFRN